MAKREKDKLYYEITREKPYGFYQMLMVGGAAGSVLGFLVISLVGAYEGTEMDTLVLSFLAASFLGFFFGLVLTWLSIRHFEKLMAVFPFDGQKTQPLPSLENVAPFDATETPVLENDETKGKSVDFVFPELSPDKQ
jgi:hypothetical protein